MPPPKPQSIYFLVLIAPTVVDANEWSPLHSQSPSSAVHANGVNVRPKPEVGVFRRPSAPAQRVPNRSTARPSFRRDPSKWVHYDLKDVDEDGSLSNGAIASAFFAGLRERRQSSSEGAVADDIDMSKRDDRRIVFRSSRGRKKPRVMMTADPQPSGPSTLPASCVDGEDGEEEEEGDDGRVDPPDQDNNSNDVIMSPPPVPPMFVSRKNRRQIRSRTSEEIVAEVSEVQSSPTQSRHPA